jgi:hypothetical protein
MTRATSTIFFFVSFVWKLWKIKKRKVCQLNPVSPMHGARIAFMCFVWISEQTATFAL